MYARTIAGRTLNFEASGGLIHGSLVMQDRETDTYWSLMASRALSGELADAALVELPGARKLPWKAWVAAHPDTRVLSVNGREDLASNPYGRYFASESGFRGLEASDPRLPSKAPIFALTLGARRIAVPFRAFAGGASFSLAEGHWAFLHRPAGVPIFHSTVAVESRTGFERRPEGWIELGSGARFDPERGAWVEGRAGARPAALSGYDTFWVTWSLTHPETEILEAPARRF